jgi:CelD/BcsL family acetyltransferase involved in cellulose biosynthesis
MQLRVVTSEQELRALQPEWDALHAGARGAYYSLSFAWCLCGWETVAKPRGRILHCIVGTDEGRIVLVWPLVRQHRATWSIIRPLNGESSEYSDVLVEDTPDADSRVARAWDFVKDSHACDILRLPFVREGSRLYALVRRDRLSALVEPHQTSMLDWGDAKTWVDYCVAIGKTGRRSVTRKRRRLLDTGALVFESSARGAERGAVIAWMIAEKRRWLAAGRRDNDWLPTPEYLAFMTRIADIDAAGGLVVSVLRWNGDILAACAARIHGKCCELVLTAFNPDYSHFSPGALFLEDLLQWCFTQGYEVDFRIGSDPYKDRWRIQKARATSYDLAFSGWGRMFVVLKSAIRHVVALKRRSFQRTIPALKYEAP